MALINSFPENPTAWRVENGNRLKTLGGTFLVRIGTGNPPSLYFWDKYRREEVEIDLITLQQACQR